MAPRADLASTHYCLANRGVEYLIYLREGSKVTVDLLVRNWPVSVLEKSGQSWYKHDRDNECRDYLSDKEEKNEREKT